MVALDLHYHTLKSFLKKNTLNSSECFCIGKTTSAFAKNFSNKIAIVVGDEWLGGNLSYHLQSRPRWFNSLSPDLKNFKFDGGVIYVGNANVLKSICPGKFGKIQLQGICMIGVR